MLLRHAKSDWSQEDRSDHERPLNRRGQHAAPLLGEKMMSGRWLPDRILCSTAVRAQQTLQGLQRAWDSHTIDSIPVETREDLYLAMASTIQKITEEHHGNSQSLLIIGHNPGLELLASLLAGEPISMKTAHLVVFEAESWQAVHRPAAWQLIANFRGEGA
jgi:phosphohistidine phosphatase